MQWKKPHKTECILGSIYINFKTQTHKLHLFRDAYIRTTPIMKDSKIKTVNSLDSVVTTREEKVLELL